MDKGHINLHKAQTPPNGQSESSASPPFPTRHRIAAAVRSTPWKSTHRNSYPRPLARSGKSRPNPHRNRTLILNKTTNTPHSSRDLGETSTGLVANALKTDDDDDDDNGNGLIDSATSWVAKRDRHMQLINSSIYEKESQLRSKAMDETRRQRAQQKDLWEKYKIETHLQSLSAPKSQLPTSSLADATAAAHQITINGLPFQVINGGSKLFRIRS